MSPIQGLDARLGSIGERVERRWDDTWLDDSAEHVIRQFVERDPDIVVIGPGVANDGVLDWVSALERHRPDLAVVLVADPNGDLLIQALRAGVVDVVAPTVTQQELIAALERANEVAKRRLTQAAPAQRVDNRRMIGMLSPKGGTGKTVIASTLGLLLQQRHAQGDIGLLDLDIQFGGIAVALGLLPESPLGDAAAAARTGLDATTLKLLLTHHPDGAYALASPVSLVEAEEIDGEHVKAVLHHFSNMFEWSIVDTPSGVREQHLLMLEFATDILLVTTPDVLAINSLRRSIEALDMVGLLGGITQHLVVNRADDRNGLPTADIEGLLDQEVAATIPPSRALQQLFDRGDALLELPPKDPALRAIIRLADTFIPLPEEPAKNGLFRKKVR